MADYQDIRGLRVKYLSADPSTTTEGEVWYNSTTGTLKGTVLVSAWSSAPAPNRKNPSLSSGGTQTAAIQAGRPGANPPNSAQAEEYNGASWTNLPDIPAAYGYSNGCGTISDFSQMGGGYPSYVTNVYDWDSSSWTAGAALPTATIEAGCDGPGEQAIYVGGGVPPSQTTGATHERDGGSWTTTNPLNQIRYVAQVSGTKTSAIASGGTTYPFPISPGTRDVVESYNGASWTVETVLPAIRTYAGSAGSSSTDQIVFGGDVGGTPGGSTSTIKWDGTAWTAQPSLATVKSTLGGFGTTTAALSSCGGYSSPGASEEFNVTATVQTLTTS